MGRLYVVSERRTSLCILPTPDPHEDRTAFSKDARTVPNSEWRGRHITTVHSHQCIDTELYHFLRQNKNQIKPPPPSLCMQRKLPPLCRKICDPKTAKNRAVGNIANCLNYAAVTPNCSAPKLRLQLKPNGDTRAEY